MIDEHNFPPGVDALIRAVDDAVGSPAFAETEQSWQTLVQRLDANEHHTSTRSRRQRSALPWYAWGGTTVAILLAIGVMMGRRDPSTSPSGRVVLHRTMIGTTQVVRLGDGISAILAPESQLAMHGTTAELSGEALFSVAGHAHTPFVVRTGKVVTRVLGTRFAVRHYRTDRTVRVAVFSGKVSTGAHDGVALSSGRLAWVTDSNVVVTTMSHPDDYSGWSEGHLTFHDALVSEILGVVGRWYGYDFRVRDSSIAMQHVTASFEHKSREDVLEALQVVLDVNMHVDGSVVTLRRRSTHDSSPAYRRGIPKSFSTSTEVGR